MNLRPPGYEPGELPDCSTPRRGSKDSILPMPWWTWIALGVFALAVVALAIFGVYAAGRIKRLKAQGEALTAALDDVARRAEELERRAAHASERAAEVERARAELDGSLERLSVLSWALGDARKGITRLRGTYPRK